MQRGKIKVNTYTRVSTTIQIDGYSIDAQNARMKAFADYNDYEIIGEYEEAGKSGRSIEGCMEISEYIGYKNLTYMTRTFLKPLLEKGKLLYTIPEKPQSRLQKYIAKH